MSKNCVEKETDTHACSKTRVCSKTHVCVDTCLRKRNIFILLVESEYPTQLSKQKIAVY